MTRFITSNKMIFNLTYYISTDCFVPRNDVGAHRHFDRNTRSASEVCAVEKSVPLIHNVEIPPLRSE